MRIGTNYGVDLVSIIAVGIGGAAGSTLLGAVFGWARRACAGKAGWTRRSAAVAAGHAGLGVLDWAAPGWARTIDGAVTKFPLIYFAIPVLPVALSVGIALPGLLTVVWPFVIAGLVPLFHALVCGFAVGYHFFTHDMPRGASAASVGTSTRGVLCRPM